MITGGNATVFVSDMDRAVRFYTETLRLKLVQRYGNEWATVDAGKGLTIGLHPASPNHPSPGSKGSMMLGLEIDDAIEKAVEHLRRAGVKINGEITRSAPGNFIDFEDPDGNALYLWEVPSYSFSEHDTANAGA